MKFRELPEKSESGRDLEVENAVIKSVSLTTEDYGVLTGSLMLNIGESSVCSFGGYTLGLAEGGNLAKGDGYAAEFITRCISVVHGSNYGTWESMEGKPIRVLHEGLGGSVIAIGHYLKDSWFCPRVEFEKK